MPISVSTFRTQSMSDGEVQEVLAYFQEHGKPAVAAAELPVAAVQRLGLLVVPEESLFRWHTNIEGWPSEREEQQLLMLRLAKAVTRCQALSPKA